MHKCINFFNPTTQPTGTNRPTAEIYWNGDNSYKIQQITTRNNWPALTAATLMNTFTYVTIKNYEDVKIEMTFTIRTTSVTLTSESRIFLVFPEEYNPGFGGNWIYAFINLGSGDTIVFTEVVRDRTII